MKKVIIISLGGSLIIPEKININLLNDFKKVLSLNKKKYKFIVVCGGGHIARVYMTGITQKNKKSKKIKSLLGISITRQNAKFLSYFFNKPTNLIIPRNMKQVRNLLKKNDFVFCGGLRFAPDETTDSTAAKLAREFRTKFINLTDVAGLYDKNPKKSKSAKFIPEISYKDFLKISGKSKFVPGQHFVLDQHAAKIIKNYKIPTYILGPDMKNFNNFLNNKHFIGTIISN